jgi:hypothetical protein
MVVRLAPVAAAVAGVRFLRVVGGGLHTRAALAKGPTDTVLEVDPGHDAALDEVFVGAVVGLLEPLRQQQLHHVIDQRPAARRHARGRPLFDQHQHQHLGTQDVGAVQLVGVLQETDAQAKVVELAAHLVQHPQHQAG